VKLLVCIKKFEDFHPDFRAEKRKGLLGFPDKTALPIDKPLKE